jgi:hypothetical protein
MELVCHWKIQVLVFVLISSHRFVLIEASAHADVGICDDPCCQCYCLLQKDYI